MYGGQSLFQQYDEEAQEDIRGVLEDIYDTLSSACRLLDRVLGTEHGTIATESRISQSPLSQSSSNGSTMSLPVRRSSSSTQLFTKLRWSFRDKRRAKEILTRYSVLNDHLHATVEMLNIASSIGVGLQHLENMQQNPMAKQLGFDENAALRLAAASATHGMTQNYELDDEWSAFLENLVPVEDKFLTASNDGTDVLQENCEYKLEYGTVLNQQTRSRLNGLACLLQQPKEHIFRIPRCIGWRLIPSTHSIAFMFQSPLPVESQPRSLLQLVKNNEGRPSLRDKFTLALTLARSISQLQMVQWVHESFRSENILFLLPLSHPRPPHKQQLLTVPFHQPWIFGFDFSRPETYFSHGFVDVNIDRDIYRHPDRQGHPTAVFNKWHDIYSLGVVLLEIGLWELAVTQDHPNHRFIDMKDQNEIKHRLIKVANNRLASGMGPNYTEIVVKCLTGDFGIKDDSKEDIKLQQAFRTQIVNVLDRALANI